MPPTLVRLVLAVVLLASVAPALAMAGEGEPRALASRALPAQVTPPQIVLLEEDSSEVAASADDLLNPEESQIRPGRPLESAVLRPIPASAGAPRRPASLMPLYVSFGTLQLADAATTFHALERGGVEANPVLRGVADNRAALLAVKAAGAAVVIYAGEKLWRRNRVAAVVLLAALNGAYAYVVAHNYRAAR